MLYWKADFINLDTNVIFFLKEVKTVMSREGKKQSIEESNILKFKLPSNSAV